MEANNNPLSNLELFEELNNQVSEKIRGGVTVEALLADLANITILDSNLQTQINQKIRNAFPKGLGNATSLACATENGQFSCKVSSNGQTKSFKVPL